ncbi:cytoplasmic tRNA 2-thiolation protein 2 [Thalassophryne amazonica]|uniref:cytoplasmic tRNA 2-thiolation protein 2 n=1 Tax=Thalassophryne amazonica TaxID=390379 RepID=UPI0014720D72|nr:cytoplasmic tRNA 2-thiolation protein 2 [Thalassophryne amazonica]
MCQVEEDYRGQLQRPQLTSVSKKCSKCSESSAVVVIRAGDPFCRSCFKEYFIHKFRAMLGKNRVIFPGEQVLLAVSGGPSSSSMLHQVQEGLSQNAHKRLRFRPGIVYIDEGGAVGRSVEQRQRTVAQMVDIFKASGFLYHIVPLEQVLHLPTSVLLMEPISPVPPASAYKAAVDQYLQTDSSSYLQPVGQEKVQAVPIIQDSHTTSLQQLMASAVTLTAREELLNTLRQHLLVHTARTRGYSKVMLGDSCSRLAVKLLSSVCMGRGAQLADLTGFSDSRFGDITFVRPMRDYSAKEISYYNHLFKVLSVFVPGLDTKAADKASIQRLTENFLMNLQLDFPSTVSTIYRTSEKLQTDRESRCSAADKCLLCLAALDTSVEDASAFQATLISEQLSQTRSPTLEKTANPTKSPAAGLPESTASSQQCCSPTGDDCGRTSDQSCSSSGILGADRSQLKKLLCYSCQLTLKDVSSVELLPPYMLSEAKRRQNRSEMRAQISDFLLDGADG